MEKWYPNRAQLSLRVNYTDFIMDCNVALWLWPESFRTAAYQYKKEIKNLKIQRRKIYSTETTDLSIFCLYQNWTKSKMPGCFFNTLNNGPDVYSVKYSIIEMGVGGYRICVLITTMCFSWHMYIIDTFESINQSYIQIDLEE